MEYTKGEWEVWQFSKFHNWKVSTGDANWFVDCGWGEEALANARLITAAPDLYEALENLIFYASNDGVPWLMLQQAIRKGEEAIAKVGKGR